MTFDWDAANADHIARHAVTPQSASKPIDRPLVIKHQERKRERRRLCLGETNNGRLLTFVVTERQGKIRFVTAYPMPPQMRAIYRGED